jgi:hypothetical protein
MYDRKITEQQSPTYDNIFWLFSTTLRQKLQVMSAFFLSIFQSFNQTKMLCAIPTTAYNQILVISFSHYTYPRPDIRETDVPAQMLKLRRRR